MLSQRNKKKQQFYILDQELPSLLGGSASGSTILHGATLHAGAHQILRSFPVRRRAVARNRTSGFSSNKMHTVPPSCIYQNGLPLSFAHRWYANTVWLLGLYYTYVVLTVAHPSAANQEPQYEASSRYLYVSTWSYEQKDRSKFAHFTITKTFLRTTPSQPI